MSKANEYKTAQKENIQLFSEWVESYSDHLFQWAFYKTSSKETAEDLVQETFLAAFKSMEHFEGNSHPRSWLLAILNNKIVDYYRSGKNRPVSLNAMNEDRAIEVTEDYFTSDNSWKPELQQSFWDEQENLLDNREFILVFEQCIGDLPDKWNQVISERYIANKSSELICQDLKISSTNYWQIVHRAKLLLKKCIEINWHV